MSNTTTATTVTYMDGDGTGTYTSTYIPIRRGQAGGHTVLHYGSADQYRQTSLSSGLPLQQVTGFDGALIRYHWNATAQAWEVHLIEGDDDKAATERQIQYLASLTRRARWRKSDIASHLKTINGVDVSEWPTDIDDLFAALTRRQASDLIDEMKSLSLGDYTR